MGWFTGLRIRNKLIVIILAVSLIVVGIIGAVRIAWDIEQGRKSLLQESSALLQLIGDRSSAALIFEDTRLAKENLSSLQKIPNIVEACIYRKDNTLLALYQRDAQSQSSCEVTANYKSDIKKHWFGKELLHISTPIYQGQTILGWIYLTSDFSIINMQLQDQLIFSLLALFSAILISVLLANWAQQLISRPISEITQTVQEIEETNDRRLRIKLSGHDEISQLATTLNSMLDTLDLKNEQLRRSQKMDALGKLTGGVAHDYNNMLGIVLGYADLLKNVLNDDPKTCKYIDEIIHAGERGARLTQKLLAFSRKKNADARIVNINNLLLGEQHMLEKTLTARITLNYKLEQDLFPVWIDSDDLEDTILNISINAMHAMKEGGELYIETRNEFINETDSGNFELKTGDYAVISIADTGYGMDKDTLSNIFDPFYSTKGEKGTGLGLSQVYGFVTSSGGTIKVYSEPGKGAQFTLYLPRCHANNTDIQVQETKPVINSGSGESILVVDDETALCELAAELLSNNGYKVLKAENAKQALDILENNTIDLMLTDIIMPGMDGYELADIVQEKYPSIKIQLASGFTDNHHMTMVDTQLHQQLLRKPYSSQTLLQAINKLLTE